MREVTVYEVKAHRMPLYDGMEAVRIARLAPFTYAPQVDAAFYNPVLETTDVKVHEIHGIKGSPDYIAMSPELQEILEAPIKSKLDNLQARNDRLHATNNELLESKVKMQRAWDDQCYALQAADKTIYGLLDAAQTFLRQPWYVRVWRALRKDL